MNNTRKHEVLLNAKTQFCGRNSEGKESVNVNIYDVKPQVTSRRWILDEKETRTQDQRRSAGAFSLFGHFAQNGILIVKKSIKSCLDTSRTRETS